MAKKPSRTPGNATETPRDVTSEILEFCQAINPAERPSYVPVKPWVRSDHDWCFDNTKSYMSSHPSHGHSIVNGWNLWETRGVWLEAEAHSIIRKKDESLVDITPHAHEGHRILFLPDSFSWEDRLVANRFHPLRDDPKLHELVYVKRKIAEFRAGYPVGCFLVSTKGVAEARKHLPAEKVIELGETEEAEYKALEDARKRLLSELKLRQFQ